MFDFFFDLLGQNGRGLWLLGPLKDRAHSVVFWNATVYKNLEEIKINLK